MCILCIIIYDVSQKPLKSMRKGNAAEIKGLSQSANSVVHCLRVLIVPSFLVSFFQLVLL